MFENTAPPRATSDITLANGTLHNPDERRHFMKLKPVNKTVRIWHQNTLLAESNSALRILEIGRDFYDPVIYLPQESLRVKLRIIEGKTTHCPIKGNATYFDVEELPASDGYLAWSYRETLDFADELKNLVAFNPERVTIVEGVKEPALFKC